MRIGFDIGGTKIEVVVLTEAGECIFKHRTPSPRAYDPFVTTITKLVQRAEADVGEQCSVGVGMPGAVHPSTGLIQNCNLTFINGRDLKQDLEAQLKRSVNITNDANCFALSEAIDGAGRGYAVVFGAILGTGCGGGLVVNQQLIEGPNAATGEWGHNPLPTQHAGQDGPERACYCGRHNCIERYISGSGLVDSYRIVHGEELSAPQIIQAAQAGEPQALITYQQLLDQMARAFAAIVNILDPDVIVLGGGLSNVDSLYQDLPDSCASYVFADQPKLRFRKAVYGDSSGVRGAAWLSN